MKSTEMHVVIDMNAHREAIHMSKQALADKVHKDVSVVVKQITETKRSNMTMFNAYEFAEALGGAIVFLTDEQLDDLNKIDELKTYAEEIVSLRSECEKLRSDNKKLTERIEKQHSSIEKLDARIEAKDDAITRKDALLNRLLKQKEAATKVMHKEGIDLSFLDNL